jgi:hypothetical protein
MKNIIKIAVILIAVAFLAPTVVLAACTKDSDCKGAQERCVTISIGQDGKEVKDCKKDTFGINPINTGIGGSLGNKSLQTTIGSIINVVLGLLGVIAVVIILVGGFKWMTAGGNEEKVTEARTMIFQGIIGLAIILSAWAIALFVLNSLSSATGSGAVPTDFSS